MMLLQLASLLFACSHVVLAAPAATAPTVTIAYPQATIVGVKGDVEIFPGVRFAKPPVGALRLKPPQRITDPQGTVFATANGNACPQFILSTEDTGGLPTGVLGVLLNTPFFQKALSEGEDCLNINIHRPAGTTAADKLPVLFWIFGGAFELGFNSMYDGAPWVADSIDQGKPIIFVSVNYRVGGFGFLPGKEILADGSSNLGLLDQRLALEWISDNIGAFGGDPTKVTIWGESAGAISVLDQMALYDGNNTFKGKPLFRAGILNSGSLVPADPVDCPKGQAVYNKVVATGGCTSASNTLECLRNLPYAKFLNAVNSVPSFLSYNSIGLSYLPRPDGKVLTASPDVLIASGRYAKIPIIIGNQEDEGTLFSLTQSNISTKAQLATYLQTIIFNNADEAHINDLIATYPDTTTDGSPFRTGIFNNVYPQFKRLAAILGDLSFTLSRRLFLNVATQVAPNVPAWAYMSSYDWGTPILGTFHASDLIQVFFGILPNYAAKSTRSYYLSFVTYLDPNTKSGYQNWPKWNTGKQLLNFYPLTAYLIDDDFRDDTYQLLTKSVNQYYI